MMNKKAVSDSALIVLVAVALIVSIGGALVSLNKLRVIEITGKAISGSINVTAASNTDIAFIIDAVNFTSISAGSTNDTTDAIPPAFQVQNDGNTCVNITLQRTQTTWLSGSVEGGNANNNNNTLFNATCNDATLSCRSGHPASGCIGAGTSICFFHQNTTWRNLSQAAVATALTGLNYSDASDNASVQIKVHVPSDESAGTKSTVVTFTASSSGLC